MRCESIRNRYHIIGHIKGGTKITKLCEGYPKEFAVYLQYTSNLKFGQTPDYKYLKQLFRRCLHRNKLSEDKIFDWSEQEEKALVEQQQQRKVLISMNKNLDRKIKSFLL